MNDRDSLFQFTRTGSVASPTNAEPQVVWSYVRELTDDELAGLDQAPRILAGISVDAPFAELWRRHSELLSTMNSVVEADSTAAAVSTADSIPELFNGWLAAFRGFADRTDRWLKHEMNADAATEFRRQLSVEFDRNFAYRVCDALRNVSQHAVTVINDARLTSGIDDDDETITRTLRCRIDPNKLPLAHVRAATRDELLACPAPLHARRLAVAAMHSCEAVHHRMIDFLWPEVGPLVDLVTRLHYEVGGHADPRTDPAATWAVFMNRDRVNDPDERHGQLRYNPYNYAELITRNRAAEAAERQQLGGEAAFTAEMFWQDNPDLDTSTRRAGA